MDYIKSSYISRYIKLKYKIVLHNYIMIINTNNNNKIIINYLYKNIYLLILFYMKYKKI